MSTNKKKGKKTNLSSTNIVSKNNKTLLTTALTSSIGLALTPTVNAANSSVSLYNLTDNTLKNEQPANSFTMTFTEDDTFQKLLESYQSAFNEVDSDYNLYYIENPYSNIISKVDTSKNIKTFVRNHSDARYFIAKTKSNAKQITTKQDVSTIPTKLEIENSFILSLGNFQNKSSDTSSFTVKRSYFANNAAKTTSGGALRIYGNGSVNNSVFEENRSSQGGGAIYYGYQNTTSANIQNSSFIKNSTSENKYGGALYVQGSLSEIKNSSFIENASTGGYGGAIAFGWTHNDTQTVKINISDTIFKKNKASYGGAISVSGYEVNIEKSTFEDNEVNGNGNVIFFNNNTSTVNIKEDVILKNNKNGMADIVFGASSENSNLNFVTSDSSKQQNITIENGIVAIDKESNSTVTVGSNYNVTVNNNLKNIALKLDNDATFNLGTQNDKDGNKSAITVAGIKQLSLGENSNLNLKNGVIDEFKGDKLVLTGDANLAIDAIFNATNNGVTSSSSDSLNFTEVSDSSKDKTVTVSVNATIANDLAQGIEETSTNHSIFTNSVVSAKLAENSYVKGQNYLYKLGLNTDKTIPNVVHNSLKITKVASFLGLPGALVNEESSYTLKDDEVIYNWGAKEKEDHSYTIYTSGEVLHDISVEGNNHSINLGSNKDGFYIAKGRSLEIKDVKEIKNSDVSASYTFRNLGTTYIDSTLANGITISSGDILNAGILSFFL